MAKVRNTRSTPKEYLDEVRDRAKKKRQRDYEAKVRREMREAAKKK